MTDQPSVQARILRKVRVLNTPQPGIVVLELSTGEQTDYLGIPRSELDKIGDLLKKNAADPKAADGAAPGDVG